ncbi:MAG: rod shape-determining protein MreD [Nitrospinae bacterium]|nr:rod shape-determining protein MreD [Nitrospinota bacterium]MBI3814720.1 rod shape-determining protein MreD [Nitrospinota bacterium]
MFFLFITILAIVVFILETVVIDLFAIGDTKPDFILLTAVYSGLFLNKNNAAGIGFVFGLIQDALSFRLMGINSLSKCLVGFSIGALREKILSENLIVQCLFTLIATFINGIIFFTVSKGLLSSDMEALFFFKSLLMQGVYNLLLAPVMFSGLNKVRKQRTRVMGHGSRKKDLPLDPKFQNTNFTNGRMARMKNKIKIKLFFALTLFV